ncbi:hypothetical protein Agub_g9308, partial [Astrephomene gubernaculifera]
MPLLRRRNWRWTCLAFIATCFAYAGIILWARSDFLEQHYYAKQRLWAQFLATCDCDGQACPESFDLTMMHPRLYSRLLAAAEKTAATAADASRSGTPAVRQQSGFEPVQQYLIWQPYKVTAVYRARLRMYVHMGLVLPRSLALLHSWWFSSSEDLALALQHLAQGVPLALDPSSREALRVEPDAVIECTLEAEEDEGKGEKELARSGGTTGKSGDDSSGTAGVGEREEPQETGEQGA